MKKIILTGGGTAGHIMPNVALIPKLLKHFEIHYIGTDGMEKQIISKIPKVTFHEIQSAKFRRSFSFKAILKNLTIPFQLLKGIMQSKKLIKEINPSVVFSKGGYASVPIVLAAKGIPVISHESDFTFGLANKIIYRKSTLMLTSFEETSKNKPKCKWVGTIIRDEIFNGSKLKVQKELGINSNPTLLVMGGSLGASKVNELIFNLVEKNKLNNFNVIHIAGKGKIKTIKKSNYFPLEFSNNIWDLFAAADMVISRAGSNSIFELLALCKPMLLLPLSKKASRGDQILNAKVFKENNLAEVIYDEDLTEESLLTSINSVIKNKEGYIKTMKSSKLNKLANQETLKLLSSY